jgi:hypothetical protein
VVTIDHVVAPLEVGQSSRCGVPSLTVPSRVVDRAREPTMSTPAQTTGAWDAVAAGYDEFVTPLLMPLAQDVPTRIDLRPGVSVLDVAPGTGALSLPAARLGAQVIATDIAAGYRAAQGPRERRRPLQPGRPRHGRPQPRAGGRQLRCLGIAAGRDGHPRPQAWPRRDRPGDQAGRKGADRGARSTADGRVLRLLPRRPEGDGPGLAGAPTDPPPAQFQVADPAKFRERLAEARLKRSRWRPSPSASSFRPPHTCGAC